MSPAGASGPVRIHASAVALGEAGILIRGPSGAGKSALALELIGEPSAGAFARLVADDRTEIRVSGGRLIARPVRPIEGLVERRGLGLTPIAHLPAAVLRLVVDLGEEPARMPEPQALTTALLGVTLPRLALKGRPGDAGTVRAALALFLG